jgi:RNA polymerase sigma-70 factor (ECF subfamily)
VQIEDRVLVWRLHHGDAGALARIYEKYRDDLLRLAAAMLNDRTGAEDVVQDTFVGFAGSARMFRLTGSLKGYLTTCVANAARNRLKAAAYRRTADLDEAAEQAACVGDPQAWLIMSEEFATVSEAMALLPPEQREVVTLHLYGDLPFKDIARWQGTSIKTVQSRYRYALQKLRSLVDREVNE